MTTLIDKAKEIRDAIRHCANSEGVSGCKQCYYYTNGCRYSLMLVSARIIDRLAQELKEESTMSESREHKRRYNLRLEYIAHFTEWLDKEPPMVLFWKWRKWKRERPIWKES